MLAVLSACSKWKSLQRWGLFFNPQTFGDFFLKAEHCQCHEGKRSMSHKAHLTVSKLSSEMKIL